jgi:hypothetical protein
MEESEPQLERICGTICTTIKSECLDRILPLGERHLRRAIGEYLAHYHGGDDTAPAGAAVSPILNEA